MIIKLDEDGPDGLPALHWLLAYHPDMLHVVMRRLRREHYRRLDLKNAARWMRKHGPVVSVEPNTGGDS